MSSKPLATAPWAPAVQVTIASDGRSGCLFMQTMQMGKELHPLFNLKSRFMAFSQTFCCRWSGAQFRRPFPVPLSQPRLHFNRENPAAP
jgi:hypothetical protein